MSLADPDPISVLRKIENELDLTKFKYEIDAIKTELWFLGTFLRLTSENVQRIVKSFLLSVEDLIRSSDFEDDVSFLLQKIKGFKSTITSAYSYPGSPGIAPLTHEIVVEFIDDVVWYLKTLWIDPEDELSRSMEEVEKELRAIRNFVLFLGKICSSEQQSCWQNLLRHVEFVATLTAIIFSLNMEHFLSDLKYKIKPIVRVINTDILRYLNLSSGTRNMLLIEAADGFIETLLHISMELRGVSSLTVKQTETFAVQVNGLRVFLKELPLINDIQDEMRSDFFKLLEGVVIHAGLVLYSLFGSIKNDPDQELSFVYNKIESVKKEIYHKIRDWVTPHFPKNDKLGFSHYLLDSLKEFLSGHSASLASVKDQLEVVHEELIFLEPFLMPVAEQGNNKHNKLHNLVGRLVDKAYEEIELIKTELTKPEDKNMTNGRATDEELVGFGDVWATIFDQLVRGKQDLNVVSIVGMAGSGKTTLAQSFIKVDIIDSRFDFLAECCVSQKYTLEGSLLSILSSAKHNEPIEISKRGAGDLADKLRKTLLSKRYLLIIDDVWEVEAWRDLRLCFPDTRNGSRIILTTRHKEVALYANLDDTEPHYLRSLDNSESWSLLEKRVFGEGNCPEELKEVGQNIAKKCNGLPLSIVLVAGLLAKMDKTERCWTRMELSFGETVRDGAKDLVKLSYDDLPYKLKPCFLYFGAFLEDREISVSKLTNLWIAEAFIKNDEEKSLEAMSEDYLEDLIGRNLVMVAKRRSNGKIKACRVHDIMLDFCKEKAKEDNFLLWLKRTHNSNPPHFYSERPMHRRLSFYSNRDDLAGWRPSCSHARSILFRELSDNTCSSIGHASIIFGKFKFLRVLDLEAVVVESFPTELSRLRYLAVQITKSPIPPSIENLWNLQTFIVKRNGGQVWLPDTFWKLSKLRYVSIGASTVFSLHGAQESRDESPLKLDNLETLSSIYVSRADNMERIVRRTPNLRKLRCIFADFGHWGKNYNRFPALDSLSRLETLKAECIDIPEIGPSRLNFPMNLKKLTLCKFPLPPVEISTIANLLNLEVLKLQEVAFEMDEWEVGDEEFPKLKFLELEHLKLSKWEVSEEAFGCLEKFVLHGCLDLVAIPDCFEELGNLQYIEVKSCSEDVADSARNIKDTRVDNGHKCDVKVFS